MKSLIAIIALVMLANVHAEQSGVYPDFPFYKCSDDPYATAYQIVPDTRQVGDNTYCFMLTAYAPSACDTYCCTEADLKKIELNVNPECKVPGATVAATVNGVPTKVAPSFDNPQTGPPGSTILRITQLGLNRTTASGAWVCLTLKPNKAGQGCTTLEDLCVSPDVGPNTCSAALFDSTLDCCSPGGLSLYKSPPPPPPAETDCTACATLSLIQSPSVLVPANISEAECQRWAANVFSNIAQQASSMGIAMSPSAVSVTCNGDSAQVCTSFESSLGASMLQPWVEAQLSFWWNDFIGKTCPAYYDPYTVVTSVFSYTPTGGYCLSASYADSCTIPDPDFPACTCELTKGATPFAASPYLQLLPGRTSTTKLLCFDTLVTAPYDPETPCGRTTTLLKAEFWADEALRRHVRSIGVQPAGTPAMAFQSASWGAKGDYTLKATPLNWNTTQADGGRLCIEVDKAVSVEKLCMTDAPTCMINFFDNSKACCPLFAASV